MFAKDGVFSTPAAPYEFPKYRSSKVLSSIEGVTANF
jgi:hypothetical protein